MEEEKKSSKIISIVSVVIIIAVIVMFIYMLFEFSKTLDTQKRVEKTEFKTSG